MTIKRIRKLKVNSTTFKVRWSKKEAGASVSYAVPEIVIGLDGNDDAALLMLVIHELLEICAIELHVRYDRADCDDYVFNYDHRQHDTMASMLAGLLSNFIA